MTDSAFPLLSLSLPPSAFPTYAEPDPSPRLCQSSLDFVYHPPAFPPPMLPTGTSSGSSDSAASPPSAGEGHAEPQPFTATRRTHTTPGSTQLTREQRALRRREQNRNAQRALRRRKEARITELESLLISMQCSETALIKRNKSLADMVDCLRQENSILRDMVASSPADPSQPHPHPHQHPHQHPHPHPHAHAQPHPPQHAQGSPHQHQHQHQHQHGHGQATLSASPALVQSLAVGMP